jgi:hypothetical protein
MVPFLGAQLRYTFAVCVRCGVQSQPIILGKDGAVAALVKLHDMGWRCQSFTYTVRAICPKCQEEEDAAPLGREIA